MDQDDDDDIPVLVSHDTGEAGREDGPILAGDAEEATQRRVPLTLISGFLGAGKSTFLKRVLTERHGQRIAVIMNEFGDTADIESKILNTTSGEQPVGEVKDDFLELANGCLCCSIKDTGVAAIEKLMRRKGGFDYILLETTGLADPGPIASIFWQNEEFAMGSGQDIYLDGVVCIVDAVFGKQQMQEDHAEDGIGESLRQIAAADVILLNKSDLASGSELQTTEDLIHKINPVAPVYRTVRGQIDLLQVIGINAYASRPYLQLSPSTHDHDQEDGDHPDHKHQTHYEVRGISSLQVSCPILSPARLVSLDEWVRTILWENRLPDNSSGNNDLEHPSHPLEVLRCKGSFSTDEGEQYVLQGVRSLYEISKIGIEENTVDVPDSGKIVLIGKGLDENVRRSLEKTIHGSFPHNRSTL